MTHGGPFQPDHSGILGICDPTITSQQRTLKEWFSICCSTWDTFPALLKLLIWELYPEPAGEQSEGFHKHTLFPFIPFILVPQHSGQLISTKDF